MRHKRYFYIKDVSYLWCEMYASHIELRNYEETTRNK